MSRSVSKLRLPPILRSIADAAGLAAALKLAQAKGGTRIYVPHRVTEGHWLAELVGLAAAQEIARLYAGENIDIPLGLTGSAQNARRAVREALDAGASVAQAARAAGVTERTVYNLRSREGCRAPNPDQGSLFDE
ncbi:transposase [Methylobacterium sp. SyP6R]|uniref:transposase n=1 Tax=Methylobacterium sp. SyP6R TaxID=2718876 RepID=UPI001F36530B|nr:helix-turn-helix domain-containing protein [Methylobacterium sp. SyP6R]MCF4125021.1 helix-turn-helix domain-containing protein [Methylobacterium sp. SyP6R]